MDRQNFARSTPDHGSNAGPELSDRDRNAIHRLFDDLRSSVGATAHQRRLAIPHP
jgi:hypothetical protein